MSPALLRVAGIFIPLVRELPEVAYQTADSFVIDSSAAQREFGLEPTPWHEVVAETVASYQSKAQPPAAA